MSKIDTYIASVLTAPSGRWVRHIILQVFILLITASVLWDAPAAGEAAGSRFTVWLSYFLSMNALVYLNIYLLAKPLLLKNRVAAYAAGFTGLIIVFVLIVGTLQSMVPDVSNANEIPLSVSVFSSLAAVALLLAGTSAMVVLRQWIFSDDRRRSLEQENLRTELEMLKSQINPHFLFNMLNNSYLLVRKRRPEAQRILLKLEDLLRYQLDESGKEQVRLGEEIEFLRDFLELEKIRRDNFSFRIEGDETVTDLKLPPMLFIPFVENAVKHNSDSENLSYINISFIAFDGGIIFRCENSKPALKPAAGQPGGIGLKNIERRLELLYPHRHTLSVMESESDYCIELRLWL